MTFAQPFKDYEILERIGSGAMGTVFKARQKRLDRIVALKVLKPSLARNTNYVERLRREARIVASLNHPDIVAGYDLGEEGGYHFFVMEYVEGRSLATLLKEWGSFPEEQVLDVALRVASALAHAFEKGVIHRDIKPGNILIDASGRAKLTDMGLAKAPEDTALTQDGATVGTPQYISPEQARDPSKADIRSDLYSLGATLFHMATGQPPFRGTSLAKVIHDVIHVRPPSAAALNPALTDGLNLVIRKLMAKDPALRYQTPAELLADLQRVRRSERPAVDEAALAGAESDRPPSPARWRAPAYAAAGLILATLAYVAWPSGGRAPAVSDAGAEQYVARLGTRLAACDGYRERLRLLAQAETAAADDAQRRAVADLRSGMLISWREALVALVRERRGGLQEWLLREAHWRDPVAALRREIADALESRFGIDRTELPAPLPAVLEEETQRLLTDMVPLASARDATLLAAWRDHHEREVLPAWRTALDGQDFVAADRALRSAGDAFFGRDGRPRRESLADALLARLDAESAAQREAAAAQTARAEDAAAQALVDVVGLVLQQFSAQLRGGDDPRLVRAAHARWQVDLRNRHPGTEAFRPGQDPWRRVRDLESAFATELEGGLRRAEQQRLLGNVQLALAALLADGDASQELGWLRAQVAEFDDVRGVRDRIAAVIEGALAARDGVLEALLARTSGRPVTVSDPAALGRSLQVAARREAGHLELVERDGARVRRLSLAAVRVSEVLQQAGWDEPRDRGALRHGLALWHYLANESAAAATHLDPGVEDVFRDHLLPAVQVVLRQRLGDDVDARAALALLRDYRALSTDALGEALATFQSRFGQTDVAAANAQFLADVRSHFAEQRQRDATLATLRAGVTPGLQVALEADGTATVRCEPAGADAVPLGAGWRRQGARFEFDLKEVGLATVRDHALVFEDSLSVEHGVHVALTLSVPPQGSRPRVWLFEVHGVGVALGCAADGSPVATVVGLDDLQREGVLQPRLERELDALVAGRAPPPLIPDARHEIEFQVRAQPQRLTLRLMVDGAELAVGSVVRPPRIAARVAVLPLQPVAVANARMRGRP